VLTRTAAGANAKLPPLPSAPTVTSTSEEPVSSTTPSKLPMLSNQPSNETDESDPEPEPSLASVGASVAVRVDAGVSVESPPLVSAEPESPPPEPAALEPLLPLDDEPEQPASPVTAATPSVFSTVRRSTAVERFRLITTAFPVGRKVSGRDSHALKTGGTCSYVCLKRVCMSDTDAPRSLVDEPRHDGVDEWEVFLRTDPTEPLFHAGSVTAPTAETAHEHASSLFGDAESIWLCPTDEMARFTTRSLGDRTEEADDLTEATP
jgi:rSAM-partnered protein